MRLYPIFTLTAAFTIGSASCTSLQASTPDSSSCDVWQPACHYTNSSREISYNITHVVIHKAQGSTAAGVASWFANCQSAGSSHYSFDKSNGYCYQSVRDEDVAWHAGNGAINNSSIGIEHSGWVANNDTSTACYDESAAETRSCIVYYAVPYNRTYIIGHAEVPGCSGYGGGTNCHTDPGPYWNWSYYMAKCDPAPPPPPSVASGVDSVCWESGRIDIVIRGAGNDVRHRWYNGGGVWSAWESLGGTIAGDPAICSWAPRRLDVFARNLNNNLVHKWYDGSVWSAWQTLGSETFIGSPDAVSKEVGRIDVVMRRSDNSIWQVYYSNGQWSSWVNHGGTLNSDPTICAQNANRLDIFARGGSNNIYQKYWDGTNWNGWINLLGTSSSGPDSASWGTGRVDIVVRGGGNAVFHKYFSGGSWSSYLSLGGVTAGDPSICSWGVNRLDVFARGGGDDIYHKYQNGGAWSAAWENLGQ